MTTPVIEYRAQVMQFTEADALDVSAWHHQGCGDLVNLTQSAGSLSFQFSMSPAQARELAAHLIEGARVLDGGCSMTPDRPLDPPDHKPFTGRVTFAATINDVTVEVKAKIVENRIDWDAAQVWWCDVDVLPVLHGSQLTAIETQFAHRYDDIVRFDAE